MGASFPVLVADMLGVKAMAFLALCLVAYLYWTGIREKLALRREQRLRKERRQEWEKKAAEKSLPRTEAK